MPVFNYARREVNAKIVYYGAGLSGKTTNLQYVHAHVRPESRGKLVSIATQTDRTLFFDFLPLDLGVIGGYSVRLHMYTVPGQVHYNATRKLVLKGVDGIVFVADSQRPMRDANIESFMNLEKNLASYGKDLRTLPHIVQANKQDLADTLTVQEVGELLNRHGAPVLGASAATGAGVQETLAEIVRLVIRDLRGQFRAEEARPQPSTQEPPSAPTTPSVEAPSPVEVPSPAEPPHPPEAPPPVADAMESVSPEPPAAGDRKTPSVSPPAAAVLRADGVLSAQAIAAGQSHRSRLLLRLPSGDEAELTVEVSYRPVSGVAVSGVRVPSIEVRVIPGAFPSEENHEEAEIVADREGE